MDQFFLNAYGPIFGAIQKARSFVDELFELFTSSVIWICLPARKLRSISGRDQLPSKVSVQVLKVCTLPPSALYLMAKSTEQSGLSARHPVNARK